MGRLYRRASTIASDLAPIVLVHGIGMSHRYFDALARELPRVREVLAVDLPGFGGTARPAQRWETAQYADYLAARLRSAGLAPAILVGHSVGAQFVAETAVRHPESVAGVVFIGPVVAPTQRSAIQQGSSLAIDSLVERPGSNAIVFADCVRTGMRWYFTELPVMLRYRIEDRMPRIQAPVLVMRGARDPVSRAAWCRELASLAADGEFVEVPKQPHVVQRSGATSVATAIVEFASRVTALP